MVAKKLGAIGRFSSEVAEDAFIDIASDLASEMAYAFAQSEDNALVLGDGSSTYGGITGLINAIGDGSTIDALTGNTAFSTLDLVDFLNMQGKLPIYPGQQPAWFISPEGFYASMARLQYAQGGATKQDVSMGADEFFLGRPVYFVNVMNATLTAQTDAEGICYYGDLNQTVTAGERRGFSFAASSDVYFTTDEIAVRGTTRVGMSVHEATDATNPGPLIMLAMPGA